MKIITLYSIYLAVPESEVPNSTAQWKENTIHIQNSNSKIVNMSFHISRRSFVDQTDSRRYFPQHYDTAWGWETAEKWEVMIHGISSGEQTRGGGPPLWSLRRNIITPRRK
jgi:hypothetical protein